MVERNEGFWFTYGEDGLLLRESVAVAKYAMMWNYSVLGQLVKSQEDPTLPTIEEAIDENAPWIGDDFDFNDWNQGGGDSWGTGQIAPPDVTIPVELINPDYVAVPEEDTLLPPDDPRKFKGRIHDYTKMGTAPIFEGDEKALREAWDYVQEQKAWWKKEFHHNRPIVNRAWKIQRKSIVKQQKEFMRDYRAQFGEDPEEQEPDEPEESEKWTVVPHDPNESTEWYFRRRLPETRALKSAGDAPTRNPAINEDAPYDYMLLQSAVKDMFQGKAPNTSQSGGKNHKEFLEPKDILRFIQRYGYMWWRWKEPDQFLTARTEYPIDVREIPELPGGLVNGEITSDIPPPRRLRNKIEVTLVIGRPRSVKQFIMRESGLKDRERKAGAQDNVYFLDLMNTIVTNYPGMERSVFGNETLRHLWWKNLCPQIQPQATVRSLGYHLALLRQANINFGRWIFLGGVFGGAEAEHNVMRPLMDQLHEELDNLHDFYEMERKSLTKSKGRTVVPRGYLGKTEADYRRWKTEWAEDEEKHDLVNALITAKRAGTRTAGIRYWKPIITRLRHQHPIFPRDITDLEDVLDVYMETLFGKIIAKKPYSNKFWVELSLPEVVSLSDSEEEEVAEEEESEEEEEGLGTRKATPLDELSSDSSEDQPPVKKKRSPLSDSSEELPSDYREEEDAGSESESVAAPGNFPALEADTESEDLLARDEVSMTTRVKRRVRQPVVYDESFHDQAFNNMMTFDSVKGEPSRSRSPGPGPAGNPFSPEPHHMPPDLSQGNPAVVRVNPQDEEKYTTPPPSPRQPERIELYVPPKRSQNILAPLLVGLFLFTWANLNTL